MPNVRIALLISRFEYHLCPDGFEGEPIEPLEVCDARRSLPAAEAAAQALVTGGTARTCRSGGPPSGRRAVAVAASGQRVSGPQGPGAHALRRLGEQVHRLGFLSGDVELSRWPAR